jgi:hypothetical protein
MPAPAPVTSTTRFFCPLMVVSVGCLNHTI